ncbi:hypothetical protein HDV01_004975 [Terramyces sp. JEL0728]|nr:hypothetical protein HDV01_004975 [Terramyces sp. JEL0728]
MDLSRAQELAKKEVAILNSRSSKLHSLILSKIQQYSSRADQIVPPDLQGRSTPAQPAVKGVEQTPRSAVKSPEKQVKVEDKPKSTTKGKERKAPIEPKFKSKEEKQPSLSDIKQFIQNQRLKKERTTEKIDEIETPLLFGKASPVIKKKEKKEFEVPVPVRGNVSRSGLVSKEKNYKTEFEIMRDKSDSRLMNAIRKQRLKELNDVKRLRSELERKSAIRTAHMPISVRAKKEIYSLNERNRKISSPPKSVKSPKPLPQKLEGKDLKLLTKSPSAQRLGPKNLSIKSASTSKISSSRDNISAPATPKLRRGRDSKSLDTVSPKPKVDNGELINLILSQINSKIDPMLQSVQEHYIKTSNMIDQRLANHIQQAKEDGLLSIQKPFDDPHPETTKPKPELKSISVASKNIFGLYNDPKTDPLELTEFDLLCIPSPQTKTNKNRDQIIIESLEETYPTSDREKVQLHEEKPKSAFDFTEPREIVIESHAEFQPRKTTRTEATSTELDKEKTQRTIILPTFTFERVVNDREKRSKWLSVYFDYSESQPPWDAIESLSEDIIKDMVAKISGEIEQFSAQYVDGLLEQELAVL